MASSARCSSVRLLGLMTEIVAWGNARSQARLSAFRYVLRR